MLLKRALHYTGVQVNPIQSLKAGEIGIGRGTLKWPADPY